MTKLLGALLVLALITTGCAASGTPTSNEVANTNINVSTEKSGDNNMNVPDGWEMYVDKVAGLEYLIPKDIQLSSKYNSQTEASRSFIATFGDEYATQYTVAGNSKSTIFDNQNVSAPILITGDFVFDDTAKQQLESTGYSVSDVTLLDADTLLVKQKGINSTLLDRPTLIKKVNNIPGYDYIRIGTNWIPAGYGLEVQDQELIEIYKIIVNSIRPATNDVEFTTYSDESIGVEFSLPEGINSRTEAHLLRERIIFDLPGYSIIDASNKRVLLNFYSIQKPMADVLKTIEDWDEDFLPVITSESVKVDGVDVQVIDKTVSEGVFKDLYYVFEDSADGITYFARVIPQTSEGASYDFLKGLHFSENFNK